MVVKPKGSRRKPNTVTLKRSEVHPSPHPHVDGWGAFQRRWACLQAGIDGHQVGQLAGRMNEISGDGRTEHSVSQRRLCSPIAVAGKGHRAPVTGSRTNLHFFKGREVSSWVRTRGSFVVGLDDGGGVSSSTNSRSSRFPALQKISQQTTTLTAWRIFWSKTAYETEPLGPETLEEPDCRE